MIPVERKPFPYCTTSPRVHSRKWQWIVSHTTFCRPHRTAAAISATTDTPEAQVWTTQQPNRPRLPHPPFALLLEQPPRLQAPHAAVARDFALAATAGLPPFRRPEEK